MGLSRTLSGDGRHKNGERPVSKSNSGIWVRRGGSGPAPTLILIHGLAANGAVWDPLLPFVEREWNGPYVIPDLRGHGRSEHFGNYSFGTFAADVVETVDQDRPAVIVGHSLGGVLGALIGTGWFGVTVEMVLALSVKTSWPQEEVAKFRSLADQPVRWMESKAQAQERFLRASGLAGLFQVNAAVVDAGIREEAGRGFRFASDPRIMASTASGVDVILRSAKCPVHFATGSEDSMATPDQMTPFDPNAAILQGMGHNAHVQDPASVWALFQNRWQRARR